MDSEELKDKYRGGDAGKWDTQQQAQVLSLCPLNPAACLGRWRDGEALGPGGLSHAESLHTWLSGRPQLSIAMMKAIHQFGV